MNIDAKLETGELRGNLTTFKVILMVVAAAAPLGALIGMLPLTFFLGAGPSAPAAFVVAGLVLVLFCLGYAAISRRVSGAGGFYDYIAKGLGRPAAAASALVAVMAYNAMTLALASGVAYLGALTLEQMARINVPWWLLAFGATGIVSILGYRSAELAGSILGALMMLELGILTVLNIGIVAHKGLAAFPSSAIDAMPVFSGRSHGLALMFALSSFIGFESAAIYAEETANPRRSIALATYGSVVLISAFYALTAWITVGAVGVERVADVARKEGVGMFFALSDQNVGSALTVLLSVTVITSLFASQLALHNAASRYMFAVGRERLLPQWIGESHAKLGTPSRASLVQSGIAFFAVAIFALLGLDPYLHMTTFTVGLGTLGIIVLQAAAAFAIVRYFWSRRASVSFLVILGPAVAGLVFTWVAVLIIENFKTLTGATSDEIYLAPIALLVAAVSGLAYSFRLKARSPDVYAALGSFARVHVSD